MIHFVIMPVFLFPMMLLNRVYWNSCKAVNVSWDKNMTLTVEYYSPGKEFLRNSTRMYRTVARVYFCPFMTSIHTNTKDFSKMKKSKNTKLKQRGKFQKKFLQQKLSFFRSRDPMETKGTAWGTGYKWREGVKIHMLLVSGWSRGLKGPL